MIVDFPTVAVLEKTTVPFGNSLAEECSRPPALMVLNEPETSLHPDLLGALARLIAQAAERTQVLVVTHAAPLISALMKQEECHSIVLEKIFGETAVVGMDPLHAPSWQWPAR